VSIDINKVRVGDVFASRINPAVRIRVTDVSGPCVDVETLRADGTGIRARNIAWGTLRENYREVSP
jgi:hypothetical protein